MRLTASIANSLVTHETDLHIMSTAGGAQPDIAADEYCANREWRMK